VEIGRRYSKRRCPLDCPGLYWTEITSLSDFFAVFHSVLEPQKTFWFRGHPKAEYELAPSALRYPKLAERNRALTLIDDMKRFLEMKLPRPPASDDRLGWMQVAQHYGLPTRLLDWTQNAAAALFFCCYKDMDSDGLVVILNPIELNQNIGPTFSSPRIFDAQNDAQLISPYFDLGGKVNPRGRYRTIAINPTLNTERIAMQQGVFTLHGSRKFALDRTQASSLLYAPILREHKEALLYELERAGIGEMFIFPEPEHVCNHLRRSAKL